MMNMNLTAYNSFPINEYENKIIENMDEYLSTMPVSFTRENLQPFKEFSKNLELKLDLPEYLVTGNPAGYIRIEVFDKTKAASRKFYYFVDRAERLANETVKFYLSLDTLNTYSNTIFRNLSNKTIVKREHRDRFNVPTSINDNTRYFFSRKFDRIAENINPPLERTDALTTLNPSNENKNHYYLIYKTPDTISTSNKQPIECLMVNDEQLLVKAASGTAQPIKTITANDLQPNQFYYIVRDDSPYAILEFATATREFQQNIDMSESLSRYWKENAPADFNYSNYYCYGVILEKVNDTLKAYPIMQYKSSQDLPLSITIDKTVYLTINSIALDQVTNMYVSPSCTSQISDILNFSKVQILSGTTGAIYTQPFSTIDRTDSRLIKIIQTPYCPVSVSKDSKGVYSFADFKYQNGLLTLTNLNIDFLNDNFNAYSLDNLTETFIKTDEATLLSKARYINDSKLYTSEFYLNKYIYDNFSFALRYEDYDFDTGFLKVIDRPKLKIKFKMTNTINSNFAFSFDLTKVKELHVNQDYLYLVSSRNNESTIYNNDYINYIRTGYNYDKKSKSMSTTAAWSTFALSSIGSVVGMVANPATIPLATVGMAGTLLHAVNTQASAENSFNQKLDTLKMQSTSVSGIDDLDILNFYNGNKLQKGVYQVREEMFKNLDDLFYYYGYATNQMKYPNINNRVWFNFIQCEAIFKNAFLLENHIEEIIDKLKEGVTIFHKVSNTWNIEQDKENYEIALFNVLKK